MDQISARVAILARLQDERGIALVMAIGIMFVLTITVSSVMVYTAASAGHANNSNAGQKAYALAEAGVDDALAVLNANYPDTAHPYPGNGCLLHPRRRRPTFPHRDSRLTASLRRHLSRRRPPS